MLYTPGLSSFAFTYDNWGANPSATPGVTVTPGASNAEGAWTQIATGANIASDCYAFTLSISGGASSAARKPQLLDIGIDPAGGTSYTAVISDLVIGGSSLLNGAAILPLREYFFWWFIKAGASVAVRIQGGNATAGTVRVAAQFFGKPNEPLAVPVGSISQTFGTITGSNGQTVTPGTLADGAWTDLGASTNELWWWQLGVQVDNTAMGAIYMYFELAFGNATNKHTIFKTMILTSSSEVVGAVMATPLSLAYYSVPAGQNIYVRSRASTAPNTGVNVTVVGIGG